MYNRSVPPCEGDELCLRMNISYTSYGGRTTCYDEVTSHSEKEQTPSRQENRPLWIRDAPTVRFCLWQRASQREENSVKKRDSREQLLSRSSSVNRCDQCFQRHVGQGCQLDIRILKRKMPGHRTGNNDTEHPRSLRGLDPIGGILKR